MQEVNQDQYEVMQFEKETVMLAVRILEKDCGRFFNIIPVLKFFSGLYLTREDIKSCEETLDSISEAISNYKRYLLNQDTTLMYYLEDDYVKLFNKVAVKSIFNKSLLDVNIFINNWFIDRNDRFIYRYTVLFRLLSNIIYVLHRGTFITVDRVTTTNKECFISLDTYVSLKSACTHYLTYPNEIGILNSFPTMEKLNAHFMSDKN